ncbi:Mfd [Desulfamplus magnetovallimortis]|uniref:Transcription-repair-coupling factor n=1 Tax=Desulfamplus magnetovallimortis TaxID=1246637 RepID=A0A1W1HKE7_9BACT|nr:transcription-repair coupling factor [Desulfamplus magnetovallimortis]SLM32930.1 Mfd [Desulfamplus magnetovallimortis]
MLKNFFNIIKNTTKYYDQNHGQHFDGKGDMAQYGFTGEKLTQIELTGCHKSARAYVAANIFRQMNGSGSILAVFPDHKGAMRFMDDLRFFMPELNDEIFYFPGYHIQAYKSLSYHAKTAATRMGILYRLLELSGHSFVVTTVDTLLQKTIPKDVLSRSAEIVINGEEIDRDLLVARLNAGGYMRTSLVEEPGDYAVRGGTLDIFSPNFENPVRIELFGDYVESLRTFSPVTQRGIDEIEEAVIIPPGEMVLEKQGLNDVLARLIDAGNESGLDGVKINEYLERLREDGRFPGIESMLSIVYKELDSLVDYLPDNTLFLMDSPDDIENAASVFLEQAVNNYETARREQKLCVAAETIYMAWDDLLFKREAKGISVCFRDIVLHSQGDISSNSGILQLNFDFKENMELSSTLRHGLRHEKSSEVHEHLLEPFARWLMDKESLGMSAVAVCSTIAQAGRLNSLLQPYGIEPLPCNKCEDLSPGIYSMVGNLSSGFESLESSLAIVTDQEIFGSGKKVASRRVKGESRVKNRFITPEELKEGDIVVHIEHGLGRYDGLETITLDAMSGDFIQITFRDDDRLYLPVDRMEMVEKYVGVEGYTPLLDKIGGKTWSNARAKAKKEVEKMAGELLKLYAERRVRKGHAFAPCDGYYEEFKASFPYDETPDQLKAIEDVLSDMESESPMDRLVCGDVGYGKTEVAIRASFKAVNDGCQVAVVVPTTILAEQHLHTFRERFKGWPVTIESLSRFRSRKEQGRILKGMAEGGVDIVIGTHRLLQKDVVFKSLGLLVIDEEQRFGVKHKEALKQKRSNVDVLALTATPIPRTLHMSLTGMRDISVIATPPEDRQAIVSYISRYDDSIAADAIKKEMARGGQIFFVHNDIATIESMAERIKRLVPKLKVSVAHGRLTESELEKVMLQFVNREIDMLVCTTIVESGLDIPSANTMIINKADRFGLSQIYQLRGRIGRGDEKAYAYLFVPDENRLTRDARKRLAALMEHRDLGSGFQIAMKDLQIRGSGSALGASQSGHIAAVGYDMFLKLLDEAIADLKGEPVVPSLEPEINVTMSAHIPEDYVQSIEQRLTIYRRLSQMTELSEIAAMQDELVDRFGKLPEAGMNMLLKIMLRVLGVKAGVKKMDITPVTIHFVFSEIHQKRPLRIAGTFNANKKDLSSIKGVQSFFQSWECEYTSENAIKINLWPRNKKISKALVEGKKILKEIASMVNG